MHRLYYHEGRDAVYFAAEAKAILAVCPGLRTIDPRGLGELVVCGCVLENRTLFAGIGVLPGAARWLLRDGAVETKASYFHPHEWEEQAPLPPHSYYAVLRETLARALPRHFGGHQRIGMSLTGGLDTRLIMAQRQTGTAVATLLHVRRHAARLDSLCGASDVFSASPAARPATRSSHEERAGRPRSQHGMLVPRQRTLDAKRARIA